MMLAVPSLKPSRRLIRVRDSSNSSSVSSFMRGAPVLIVASFGFLGHGALLLFPLENLPAVEWPQPIRSAMKVVSIALALPLDVRGGARAPSCLVSRKSLKRQRPLVLAGGLHTLHPQPRNTSHSFG